MAQLVGVRANWVISSAFAITGFIAGVVAVLYVFRNGAVAPDMGQGPLLIAFVGCVIGGLGSLAGAALGRVRPGGADQHPAGDAAASSIKATRSCSRSSS